MLPASVDLSGATKLKEVAFRFNEYYLAWVTSALETITPEHRDLQQVLIYIPSCSLCDDYKPVKIGGTVPEETYLQWVNLDRVLIQLWESHGVRTKAVYAGMRKAEVRESLRVLLPEITKREVIELVDC